MITKSETLHVLAYDNVHFSQTESHEQLSCSLSVNVSNFSALLSFLVFFLNFRKLRIFFFNLFSIHLFPTVLVFIWVTWSLWELINFVKNGAYPEWVASQLQGTYRQIMD